MRYRQSIDVSNATRFSKAPMAEVEFSRMTANPTWLLPFNAGDIVPVYYSEVLPHDTFDIDLDFVIRQNTVLRPTMGKMQVDFFAYFVPNRIINESWKNVQGENTSGVWSAPEVNLAPLYSGSDKPVKIPVGSIADYYGFPTQAHIPATVLQQCNDLKFRGYLECFNTYFRDQNYQPPIPYSKLNVYEGFMHPTHSTIGMKTFGSSDTIINADNRLPDGSSPDGAISKALFGEGNVEIASQTKIGSRLTSWSALDPPLKANKLHDVFTSVLPSPQKGAEVYFSMGGSASVSFDTTTNAVPFPSGNDLRFYFDGDVSNTNNVELRVYRSPSSRQASVNSVPPDSSSPELNTDFVAGSNLIGVADLSEATGITINELRTAVATQQVYETLARGGSRYVEMLRSFFEIETESPFMDIPLELGHVRRDLDLYQVAQTAPDSNGDSPQGTLTAFGYTTNGGKLFSRTFLEHGYIHIFAVVRHRNVYSTFFAPDNFRKSTLDFYLPQFANLGEQPIRLATLNPFAEDSMEKVIGYQEAWALDYRYEPDRVHGLFRSGVEGSLNVWNYADEFDSSFEVVDGEWLRSNSQEILDRTLAVTSELAPQFKGQFIWKIDKQRPMPTYSVPGLDTI